MAERARGKGRTGPVTAEAVIDAALVVIDEEGLDALTMRRLAHDLGVEPVTIYRQLPNKDAILAGVAEKLWREMAPPEGAARAAPPRPTRPRAPAPLPARARGLARAGARHVARAERPDAAAPQRDPDHRPRRVLLADRGRGHARHAAALQAGGAHARGGGGVAAHPLRLRGGLRVRDAVGPAGRRPPRETAAAAGEPAPAPPDAGDLADYVEAIARWDPAQFAAAVDIVLDAYGEDAR